MVEGAEGAQPGEKEDWGNLMPFFQGQHRLCHSMLDPMPCSASPHIPTLRFIPRHRLEEGQASSWTRRLKVFLCCTRTKDSQSVGTKNLLLGIKISVGEIPVFPQVRITFGSTSWAAPVSLYQPLPEHFSCCFNKSHILKEENLVMGKQKPGRITKTFLDFPTVKNYYLIHRSMRRSLGTFMCCCWDFPLLFSSREG